MRPSALCMGAFTPIFVMAGIANAGDFGRALIDAVTANDPTSVSGTHSAWR